MLPARDIGKQSVSFRPNHDNKQDNQGHWKPEEATKRRYNESESSDSLP
jgi:hypothetical protein